MLRYINLFILFFKHILNLLPKSSLFYFLFTYFNLFIHLFIYFLFLPVVAMYFISCSCNPIVISPRKLGGECSVTLHLLVTMLNYV